MRELNILEVNDIAGGLATGFMDAIAGGILGTDR